MQSRTYLPALLALAAAAAAWFSVVMAPELGAALLALGPVAMLLPEHWSKDYTAFRARLASGANYERKNAPDLAEAMEKIATGFEAHKASVAELRGQVEKLQTKLARPGALTGEPKGDDDKSTSYTVNGKPVRVMFGAAEVRSHYLQSADGGAAVQMGDFMRAVAGLVASPESRAALSVGTDADGGYLVPSRVMGDVLTALVPESSALKAGAGILPMDGADFGAKTFTLAAVDSVPTAAWRAENGNVTESSPGFRAVVMTPRSLSFFFKVSREWLADATGTDAVLTIAMAQAFAKELDRAALRGTGTAPEPRGILNTSGIIAVANGAAGASLATTKYSNFFTAVQQVLEANGPMPTAAIMSPRSLVTLGGLVDSTGQPLQVPQMLQPLRWLHTSQVPNNLTVGASTDCSELYLGDFRKLIFAMRERMSIQRLNEAFATSGQVAFVCHVRADVAVTYPKAFAVVTGVRP